MAIRNLVDLLMLAAAWGASYLFMRVATPEFGTLALIEVRVFIAAVFLLPFWLIKATPQQKEVARRHTRPILVVGILNSAIPFSLIAYSTLSLTGGFASIINATTPLWGALVTWLWMRESLSVTSVLGLLIGFIGVLVLVWDTVTWSLTGVTLATIAGLVASLFYGIAATYTRQTLSTASTLSIATFSQVSAALVLLPFAIIYWPTQQISLQAWASVIAMGIFSTGIAYILYFRLISNVGPTQAISVTFLIPIFATVWGVLFIDETVSIQMIVGSAIILLGTAWVTGLLKFKVLEDRFSSRSC